MRATLFGLAPRRVYPAAMVTHDAGGLLPHHFTHHRNLYDSLAGLLSVALAVIANAMPSR